MERRWLAAKTCHRSPERRPSGANGLIKRELSGALSRRKASGANMELTNASCAWVRNSVKTDEVTATANPHNLLLDRA